MTAYYNENDKRAAAWLRELIREGHIAPGVVDERSILDVPPNDLEPFTQCHFFAGIGVWSRALRLAAWPDDRRVWTGSCPCQPFSAAGKGGGFDDERHLWPAWHFLIDQCRPPTIFGEQVASKDGLTWLDLVHADLEATHYTTGVADLCAAGVGAPHIRQRLWFVARDRVETGKLADSSSTRLEGCDAGTLGQQREAAERGSGPGGLADDDDAGLSRFAGLRIQRAHLHDADGRGPVNGFWSDADWLPCRDDKWRPVEPGTFPLAHGAPARVGRLRGYGNAIVAEVAKEFIEAYLNREVTEAHPSKE